MAKHRPVEVYMAVYADDTKPLVPIRTEDMDDDEWKEVLDAYNLEYAEWLKEQEEAEKLNALPEDMTDKPGPGIGAKPLVDAEHPVWKNPKIFNEGPGAIKE